MNSHSGSPDRSLLERLGEVLRPSRERGSVLVVTSFAVVGIMGMVALAVDLGMIYTARTEAQRAADSGALAGAARYAATHGDVTEARKEAISFAGHHEVRGHVVSVPADDVEVDTNQDLVRVWVAQDVETFFARVVGIDVVHVKTKAAAQARPAGEASCPLPIAVVDRWNDADGDGKYDSDESYVSCPGSGCTSYRDPDHRGTLLEIKSSPSGGNGNQGNSGSSVVKTCEAVDSPGWECWYRTTPPNSGGGGGANALRDMVDGCTDPPETVSLGQTLWAASGAGNKQSVVQHIKQYIDQNDPNAYWDPSGGADGNGCVKMPNQTGCVNGSSRLRMVPLIDPSSVSGGGANTTASTSQLAMVFLEKVASGPDEPHGGGPSGQWNVYVRFVGGPGARPGGNFDDALSKAIQLVE